MALFEGTGRELARAYEIQCRSQSAARVQVDGRDVRSQATALVSGTIAATSCGIASVVVHMRLRESVTRHKRSFHHTDRLAAEMGSDFDPWSAGTEVQFLAPPGEPMTAAACVSTISPSDRQARTHYQPDGVSGPDASPRNPVATTCVYRTGSARSPADWAKLLSCPTDSSEMDQS